MSKKQLGAILLCLIVTTIFSFHYIIAKKVLDYGVSQYSLSAWRGLLGGGTLLFLFRKKFSASQVKENILSLAFISFLGFFINQILFMKGLSLTSALNVSLISNTIPIVTALVAVILSIEVMTKRKFLGMALTFSLVTYLVISKSVGTSEESSNHMLGNTLIFLNVVAFCVAFVLGKRLLKKDFPYQILTAVMLLGGGVLMTLMSGKDFFDLYHYSFTGPWPLFYVVFEILISTSLAYLLNIKSLELMEPTKVTFFIYLQPIITGISDFIGRGVVPAPELYVVFTGILVGGYLVILNKNNS